MHVYYIWLRTPEVSVGRVRERVSRGGHHVPEEVIRRRYSRGLSNFFELYQPLADVWILCDNSGEQVEMVARGSRHETGVIYDEQRYETIQRAADQ